MKLFSILVWCVELDVVSLATSVSYSDYIDSEMKPVKALLKGINRDSRPFNSQRAAATVDSFSQAYQAILGQIRPEYLADNTMILYRFYSTSHYLLHKLHEAHDASQDVGQSLNRLLSIRKSITSQALSILADFTVPFASGNIDLGPPFVSTTIPALTLLSNILNSQFHTKELDDLLTIEYKESLSYLLPNLEDYLSEMYAAVEPNFNPTILNDTEAYMVDIARFVLRTQGMSEDFTAALSFDMIFTHHELVLISTALFQSEHDTASELGQIWSRFWEKIKVWQDEAAAPLESVTFQQFTAIVRELSNYKQYLVTLQKRALTSHDTQKEKKCAKHIAAFLERLPEIATEHVYRTFLYLASPKGQIVLDLMHTDAYMPDTSCKVAFLYDLREYLLNLGQLFGDTDISTLLTAYKGGLRPSQPTLVALTRRIVDNWQLLETAATAKVERKWHKYLDDVLGILNRLLNSAAPAACVPQGSIHACPFNADRFIDLNVDETELETISLEIVAGSTSKSNLAASRKSRLKGGWLAGGVCLLVLLSGICVALHWDLFYKSRKNSTFGAGE